VFERVMGHMTRIGGVLARPNATFARMIAAGEGNALEVLPWAIAVVAIIAPISMGQALRLLRARFFDGLIDFTQLVAGRMSGAFFGVLAAAAVLHVIERLRKPSDKRMGFDRAIDVCAFMLVPFFLISVVGFLLATLGLNLWWMPHNRFAGDPGMLAWKIAVAFGWSLGLFGLVARMTWKK
jgi:hypothetical protein